MITLAGDALGNAQVYCAVAGGVPDAEKKGMDDFKLAYKKRYGTDVQIYAPYTYDAVMIFANAMQQAKSSSPDVYLPFLQKIHYRGITGDISFDNKGDLNRPTLTLYTFTEGKQTLLGIVR